MRYKSRMCDDLLLEVVASLFELLEIQGDLLGVGTFPKAARQQHLLASGYGDV